MHFYIRNRPVFLCLLAIPVSTRFPKTPCIPPWLSSLSGVLPVSKRCLTDLHTDKTPFVHRCTTALPKTLADMSHGATALLPTRHKARTFCLVQTSSSHSFHSHHSHHLIRKTEYQTITTLRTNTGNVSENEHYNLIHRQLRHIIRMKRMKRGISTFIQTKDGSALFIADLACQARQTV